MVDLCKGMRKEAENNNVGGRGGEGGLSHRISEAIIPASKISESQAQAEKNSCQRTKYYRNNQKIVFNHV